MLPYQKATGAAGCKLLIRRAEFPPVQLPKITSFWVGRRIYLGEVMTTFHCIVVSPTTKGANEMKRPRD